MQRKHTRLEIVIKEGHDGFSEEQYKGFQIVYKGIKAGKNETFYANGIFSGLAIVIYDQCSHAGALACVSAATEMKKYAEKTIAEMLEALASYCGAETESRSLIAVIAGEGKKLQEDSLAAAVKEELEKRQIEQLLEVVGFGYSRIVVLDCRDGRLEIYNVKKVPL